MPDLLKGFKLPTPDKVYKLTLICGHTTTSRFVSRPGLTALCPTCSCRKKIIHVEQLEKAT